MPTTTRPHWKSALSIIGVTAIAVALAFAAMEAILRYSSIADSVVAEKYYFYSAPENFRDQHLEFGYAPFSDNREIAVYSRGEDTWVEYDASFRVNNAGLVQKNNIDPARPHIVVVGDSFTQGQGASPWFYDLENDFPGLPLANLGLVGTGPQHWERALDWFHERVARVDRVVVVFITNDFARPFWFARSSREQVQFCIEAGCSTIFTRASNDTPAIMAQHRRLLSRGHAPASSKDTDSALGRLRALLLQTRTGAILVAFARNLNPEPPQQFEPSKRSLQALGSRHAVAFALHLPEKAEAASGKWSAMSQEIRGFVSSLNLRYVDGLERCGLNVSDFRSSDPHPNPSGYRKIRECVAGLLRNPA